jgi:nucleotide-binding universal stress UspA family protein
MNELLFTNNTTGMSDILIAVDLSSFSSHVIHTGVQLAQSSQRGVILLSVVELGISVGLPETGPVYVDDVSERVKQVEDQLAAYKAQYPNTPIQILVTTGYPKEEILAQAEANRVSMIVTGTHGRTGINHMLLGSNAEYIIRHSRIPVLVVPYNSTEH